MPGGSGCALKGCIDAAPSDVLRSVGQHAMIVFTEGAGSMLGMQITTMAGSTYRVGPSPVGNRVRIVRESDHPVGGAVGALSFVEDFACVELVSDGQALRLICTHASGRRFRTGPVVEVVPQDVSDAAAIGG